MSVEEPKTLVEWKSYAASLEGESLLQAAKAANTASFVRTLQAEGYAPEEITTILVLFAHRFHATGERPPGNGYLDFFELMQAPLPVPC